MIMGVVADDITGANDIGGMFAKAGYSVHIYTYDGPGALERGRGDAPLPHIAILDTNSRLDDRATAYAKVFAATHKVQFWKELARVVAKQKRAPRMSWGRVVVVFQFPRGDMTREVSNLQPTIKALVDGLVVAGVFKDDNDSIVFGQDARRAATRGPLSATILVYGHVLTP